MSQRVIVAGSRSILNKCSEKQRRKHVRIAIEDSPFTVGTVVSGTAKGVDQLGEKWAEFRQEYHNDPINIDRYPAPWDDIDHPDAVVRTRNDGTKYNAAAGPIRNEQMARESDALIAIWDGESNGTASMIRLGCEHLGADNVAVYNFINSTFVPPNTLDL